MKDTGLRQETDKLTRKNAKRFFESEPQGEAEQIRGFHGVKDTGLRQETDKLTRKNAKRFFESEPQGEAEQINIESLTKTLDFYLEQPQEI